MQTALVSFTQVFRSPLTLLKHLGTPWYNTMNMFVCGVQYIERLHLKRSAVRALHRNSILTCGNPLRNTHTSLHLHISELFQVPRTADAPVTSFEWVWQRQIFQMAKEHQKKSARPDTTESICKWFGREGYEGFLRKLNHLMLVLETPARQCNAWEVKYQCLIQARNIQNKITYVTLTTGGGATGWVQYLVNWLQVLTLTLSSLHRTCCL